MAMSLLHRREYHRGWRSKLQLKPSSSSDELSEMSVSPSDQQKGEANNTIDQHWEHIQKVPLSAKVQSQWQQIQRDVQHSPLFRGGALHPELTDEKWRETQTAEVALEKKCLLLKNGKQRRKSANCVDHSSNNNNVSESESASGYFSLSHVVANPQDDNTSLTKKKTDPNDDRYYVPSKSASNLQKLFDDVHFGRSESPSKRQVIKQRNKNKGRIYLQRQEAFELSKSSPSLYGKAKNRGQLEPKNQELTNNNDYYFRGRHSLKSVQSEDESLKYPAMSTPNNKKTKHSDPVTRLDEECYQRVPLRTPKATRLLLQRVSCVDEEDDEATEAGSHVQTLLKTSDYSSDNHSSSLVGSALQNSASHSNGKKSSCPEPDYSPIPIRRRDKARRFHHNKDAASRAKSKERYSSSLPDDSSAKLPAPVVGLWGNARRYKGSVEDILDEKEPVPVAPRQDEHRPRSKTNPLSLLKRRNRLSGYDSQQPRSYLEYNGASKTPTSYGPSSLGRMTAYNDENSAHNSNHSLPRSERSRRSKSRERLKSHRTEGEPERLPSADFRPRSRASSLHRQQAVDEASDYYMRSSIRAESVHSKQSHFFNSLFPSKNNRFGYPVFPERELGIPSEAGPVSFAGFSPNHSVMDSSTMLSINSASSSHKPSKRGPLASLINIFK